MARPVRIEFPGAFYRAMASKWLARYAGLAQREIAEVLGMGTGAAVSAQMKRWAELRGEGSALAQADAPD